jgi:hypothetical protein
MDWGYPSVSEAYQIGQETAPTASAGQAIRKILDLHNQMTIARGKTALDFQAKKGLRRFESNLAQEQQAGWFDKFKTAGMPVSKVTLGQKGPSYTFDYQPEGYQPEGYKESLANAITAIEEGQDAWGVYQKMAGSFPFKSAELKRILLPPTRLGEEDTNLTDVLWGGK